MIISVDNSKIICPIFKYNEFVDYLIENKFINEYNEHNKKIFNLLNANTSYKTTFIDETKLSIIPARKNGEKNEDYWKVLEMLRISRKGYKTILSDNQYLRFVSNTKKYDLKIIKISGMMAMVVIEEEEVVKENKNVDEVVYSTNFSKNGNEDFKSQLIKFKQNNKEEEEEEEGKRLTGIAYFDKMYFNKTENTKERVQLLPQYVQLERDEEEQNETTKEEEKKEIIIQQNTKPIIDESILRLQRKILEFTNVLMNKYEELVNPEIEFDFQASLNDTIKRLDDRVTIMAKISNIREKRTQLNLILEDETLDNNTKVKFIDILLGAMGYGKNNKPISLQKPKEENKSSTLKRVKSESISPMARFEERFSKTRSIQ